MATRMTDTDRTVDTVDRRPKVWPWVLLAALCALALWWAASANNHTANDSSYNNSTTPYGMTPGTGTTGTGMTGSPAPTGVGTSGMGTSGTGDVGGVGTPSPAPTAPAGR
jgi:hypothetical protein